VAAANGQQTIVKIIGFAWVHYYIELAEKVIWYGNQRNGPRFDFLAIAAQRSSLFCPFYQFFDAHSAKSALKKTPDPEAPNSTRVFINSINSILRAY
jgi:hypothetical protein